MNIHKYTAKVWIWDPSKISKVILMTRRKNAVDIWHKDFVRLGAGQAPQSQVGNASKKCPMTSDDMGSKGWISNSAAREQMIEQLLSWCDFLQKNMLEP